MDWKKAHKSCQHYLIFFRRDEGEVGGGGGGGGEEFKGRMVFKDGMWGIRHSLNPNTRGERKGSGATLQII